MKETLEIAAIVLAAGQSKRMGLANKLLMEIGGIPMARRVVSAIQASGVGKVVVVTGFESDRVEQCLIGYDIEIVWNENYEEGMGSSLAMGARALANKRFDGILVCLGDLPYLKADVINDVTRAFGEACGDNIVIPCFGGKRGHPVVFPFRYREDLEMSSGDAGARALIEREFESVVELDVADNGSIRDLDTI